MHSEVGLAAQATTTVSDLLVRLRDEQLAVQQLKHKTAQVATENRALTAELAAKQSRLLLKARYRRAVEQSLVARVQAYERKLARSLSSVKLTTSAATTMRAGIVAETHSASYHPHHHHSESTVSIAIREACAGVSSSAGDGDNAMNSINGISASVLLQTMAGMMEEAERSAVIDDKLEDGRVESATRTTLRQVEQQLWDKFIQVKKLSKLKQTGMPLPERDQEPSSVDTHESSLPAKQTRLEHAARKLDMQMETVRNLIGMHASSRRQIGQLLPELQTMVENKILPLGSKLDVLEARLTGMVQRELTMFNEITWRLAGVTGSSGQASDMTLWRSLNDEQTKGIARAARVPPYLASDQWLAFIERGGEEEKLGRYVCDATRSLADTQARAVKSMSDNTTNKLDTIIEKVSTQSTNTDAQLTQQHLRITSKLAVAHALYDVPKRMEELVAECDSFLHSGTALTLVE